MKWIMSQNHFSDSFGSVCKHLLGFLMSEMLFFTARYIGKRIYHERVVMLSHWVITLQCCFIFYSLIGTSVSFNDRFILPSLVPFLVINFSESFSLSIQNGTKQQYNLSFIGHYTNGNKSTKYHSYIKPNNHYWLKVNVTKNTPFKLLREIPWEISFPSLLTYFCLAATTVRSISKEEKRNQRQKSQRK